LSSKEIEPFRTVPPDAVSSHTEIAGRGILFQLVDPPTDSSSLISVGHDAIDPRLAMIGPSLTMVN